MVWVKMEWAGLVLAQASPDGRGTVQIDGPIGRGRLGPRDAQAVPTHCHS